MDWESLWGRAMRGVERTFTAGWSVGELAYSLREPAGLLHDAYREAVLEDIARHGLYKRFPGEVQALRVREDGLLRAPNPYLRIGRGVQDKIVAQVLRPKARRARRLLVVSHCYGLPLPALMERLCGLGDLEGYDVVYNIMNHHYLGSFAAWPGFGLMSIQMSRMIENLRSAITGLRSLVLSLQHSFGYEEVAMLGYSIGGQLSLHVANSLPLDRLLLYCPVTSVHRTVSELGLMPWLLGPMSGLMGRLRGDFDLHDLDVLNPLLHQLQLPEEKVLVVAQSYDAMVDISQLELLRARYPGVGWLECPGTHTWPAHLRTFHAAMRQHLAR